MKNRDRFYSGQVFTYNASGHTYAYDTEIGCVCRCHVSEKYGVIDSHHEANVRQDSTHYPKTVKVFRVTFGKIDDRTLKFDEMNFIDNWLRYKGDE